MAGISIWKLLIIAGIVVMVFGTKKLSSLGSDLGGAISDFKKSFGPESYVTETVEEMPTQPLVLDAKVRPMAENHKGND